MKYYMNLVFVTSHILSLSSIVTSRRKATFFSCPELSFLKMRLAAALPMSISCSIPADSMVVHGNTRFPEPVSEAKAVPAQAKLILNLPRHMDNHAGEVAMKASTWDDAGYLTTSKHGSTLLLQTRTSNISTNLQSYPEAFRSYYIRTPKHILLCGESL